jgi:acetyl/propionyl-CoA carboxylase alpha subunit
MKLKYKNRNYNVSIVNQNDDTIVDVNGNQIQFKVNQVTENFIQSLLEGIRHNVYICDDNDYYYVSIEGKNFTLEKVKDEEKSFESRTEATDKLILVPPMPGSVVKVIVSIGEKVVEGQPLIILEAMKMETTLYSTISGIVKEVNVSAGEQVDSNKILMIIEKE